MFLISGVGNLLSSRNILLRLELFDFQTYQTISITFIRLAQIVQRVSAGDGIYRSLVRSLAVPLFFSQLNANKDIKISKTSLEIRLF